MNEGAARELKLFIAGASCVFGVVLFTFGLTFTPMIADWVKCYVGSGICFSIAIWMAMHLMEERKWDNLTKDQVVKMRKAMIDAADFMDYGDFKNGVTTPSGDLDQGEVYASNVQRELRSLAGADPDRWEAPWAPD